MKSVLLAIFVSVLSTQVYAQSTVVPTAEELFMVGTVSVKRSIFKPFDEDHYGEPLDLSERRPMVNVEESVFGTKYSKPGSKLFSNFYHNGRFYLARVPDRGVQNTYFQLSYFPPQIAGKYVAAHSLLRFEMEANAPIELVAPMPTVDELAQIAAAPESQRAGMLPQESIIPIHNAAMSAEAQWTQNDPKKAYDLRRGTRGAFTQIIRMVSMTERIEDALQSGNPVNQIRLPFCNGEGDRVLAESLRKSQADGLSKLYDTLWYNCTTLAFDILERSGTVNDNRLGFMRKFMQRRIPIFSPGILTSYGGINVAPLSRDPSLARETSQAYSRVFADGREACPAGMAPANCQTVNEMIDLITNAANANETGGMCSLPDTLEPSIARLAEHVMSQERVDGESACE